MSERMQYKNYINGKWVAPSSNAYYQIHNPANKKEILGEFPLSVEADVTQAIEAAHEQFDSWRKVPASKRAEYIYKFIDLLDQNKERLAKALTLEQGKPYSESYGEAARGVSEARFIVAEAVRLDGATIPSDRPGVMNTVLRVPIGVVAAISPWNFPVLTPIRKCVPALIAGCTVILKPSSNTPITSIIITELFEQAGLPAGAVNLVMGSGRTIGDALVSHPFIKGISFTGSSVVGRAINQKAAGNFTKMQLEMGGKNPVVVSGYKDLDRAASQIVAAAYSNAGQRCTAISRVIVTKDEADELEQLIVEKVKKLTVGNGMDKVDIGPVYSEEALDSIDGYVKSAIRQGADVVVGGHKMSGGIYDDGYYYEPTVISKVTPDMIVAKEEIFGPVLVIIRTDSIENAIQIANDVEYGLTSSIFTDNLAYVYDYIRDIESGMVHINHGTIIEGHMPFGGVKNSGVGPFSIGYTNKDFYTDCKVVYTQYKA